MDERYYMLGALGLLLVGLVVYLPVSLVRYRAAVKRARAARAAEAEGEARYLSPTVEHTDDVFAVPVVGIPQAAPPPQQVPDFHIPKVHAELDLAPEQPDEPAPPPAPAVTVAEAPVFFPEPLPEPEPLPAPEPEPLPAPEPERLPAPEPEPLPAPEPEPLPAPEPEPLPAPEPEPAPPAALPGYSLADELERLMSAASSVTAPLLTPAEHEAVVSPPAPAAEPEPTFEVTPEPLFPAPSAGQALSSVAAAPSGGIEPEVSEPEQRPSAVVAPLPMSERAPMSAPAPASPTIPEMAPRPERPAIPDYRLVAPVELHFTSGQSRIGVKPGTRSYAEFQRLAGILLDDVRSARGW